MAEMFGYGVQARTFRVSESAFDINDEFATAMGALVEAITGHLPATMAMVGVARVKGKKMVGMETGADFMRKVNAGLMNVEFAKGTNESWGIQ